jgi:hypothetical protein
MQTTTTPFSFKLMRAVRVSGISVPSAAEARLRKFYFGGWRFSRSDTASRSKAVRFARFKSGLIGVSMLVALGIGCAARPRQRPIEGPAVNAGPGSVEAARRYSEGRWSLLAFEAFPPDQSAIQVQGSGQLSYDGFGHLEMQGRVPDQATAERLAVAGIPLTNGTITSEGRRAIDMQSRTITFILQGQNPLVPTTGQGPLAMSRPRYWEVEGNQLTLTTKGEDGQPWSLSRWQKMP